MEKIETLAHEKGLDEHIEVLRRGAVVAQDPLGFENARGPDAPTDSEKAILRYEIDHKWRVPKLLYLTIITCSIGAAVQGWDQTGSNGANLSFPEQFHIGTKSDHDVLLVGLINSAPYIGSAFLGCWLSDPLNNYFGRRGELIRRPAMLVFLDMTNIMKEPFSFLPSSACLRLSAVP